MSDPREQDTDSPIASQLRLLRELAGAALQAGGEAARQAGETMQADTPAAFAEAAHTAAVELLRAHDWPAVLHTPGHAPLRTGHGAPQERIILTPLSAPRDFARGLPFAAFCHFCAVAAPPIGPLQIATMRAALALPLAGAEMSFHFDGTQARAEWQGQPHGISTMALPLEKAAISVALSGHVPGRALSEVIGVAEEVRCTGGTAAALLGIATGQLQAHIDLRGSLTVHDWLAAATILRAAGGEVMLLDEALEQAPPPNNPDQRHRLVAAASRELLEEILAMLRRAWL